MPHPETYPSPSQSTSKCSLIGDGNDCPETEFEDFPIIPARSYRFDDPAGLTPNEDGEVSSKDNFITFQELRPWRLASHFFYNLSIFFYFRAGNIICVFKIHEKIQNVQFTKGEVVLRAKFWLTFFLQM